MKLQTITSNLWFKLKNRQPLELTVTMEGTGSGVAYVHGGKIYVELTAAQVGKYVNISTPFGFRVVDVYSIHNDAVASTWQIKNTAAAVTAAVIMAANDTDIDRAVNIDNAANVFSKGDDDLRIAITVAAANATMVIDIEPTVVS